VEDQLAVRRFRVHAVENERMEVNIEPQALEVKLAATIDAADTRHLEWLAKSIGTDLLDAGIITTGKEAYRRKDGIAVTPAVLLTA